MNWGMLPIITTVELAAPLASNLFLQSGGNYSLNSIIAVLGETQEEQIATIKSKGRLLWKDTAEGVLSLGTNVLDLPIVEDLGTGRDILHLYCSDVIYDADPTRTQCDLSFRSNTNIALFETLYGRYNDGGTGDAYYAVGVLLTYQGNVTGIGIQIVATDLAGGGWNFNPAYDVAIHNTYLHNKGWHANINMSDLDLPDDSEPDGYGQNDGIPAHDHTSTTIAVPDAPSVSSHDTGFMHVYKVSSGALSTLGQYLFPSAANITDIESALRAIAGIFAYRDSVQYIVDLHAIPVAPSTSGSENIKLGALETEISQPVCPTDYVDYDCGSISLPLNEQSYLDFLCRAKLFLPFVGFVDINPEYWNGGTLSVKYRFNIIDGSFMAYVSSTSAVSNLANSLIGQYGGSACLHLPVIANSYGSIASGLVGGSMAIAAGAASGNMIGAAASAATALNVQPQMSQSNNYNASTSFLGCRKPYLLIERPVPCMSGKFAHDKGLPLNVALRLSGLRGYTVISDIDLSGITGATDNELDELRRLLSEGVYF